MPADVAHSVRDGQAVSRRPDSRLVMIVCMGEMSAEDYESVELAVGPGGSLNGLLRAWAQFVRQVENGYTDNLYEYSNDLSCRGRLAAVWPILTEKVREARQAELDAVDARLMASTVPGLGNSGAGKSTKAWWEDRRPVLLVGELAQDLA